MALSAFLVPALGSCPRPERPRWGCPLSTATSRQPRLGIPAIPAAGHCVRASHPGELDALPVLPSAREGTLPPTPAGQGGIQEKEAEGKGVTGRSNLLM